MMIFLFISVLLVSVSHATTSVVGVNLDTASNYIAKTATTKDIIYGGTAGTCPSGSSDDEVCNSCSSVADDLSNFAPCNEKRIFDDLALEITIRSDSSSIDGGQLLAKYDSTSGDDTQLDLIETTQGVSANSDYSVRINWSKLCAADSSSTDSCENIGAAKFDIFLGFATSSATTDFVEDPVTVTIIVQPMGTDETFHQDCYSDSVDPTAVEGGFCSFLVGPGDQKVEIDSESLDNGQNVKVIHSEIDEPFQRLRFYCKAISSTFCDTVGSANSTGSSLTSEMNSLSLTNNSCFNKELNIDDDGDLSLSKSDLRILDGPGGATLENGTCYGFVMASEDRAGNIGYFTPPSYLESNYNSSRLVVARPAEVTGLLEESKCFVATAAYGSGFEPNVTLLRKFRDEILLKTQLGRWLVDLYYFSSPPLAQAIAGSDLLRAATRVALYPFVTLASWILFSPLSFLAMLVFSLTLIGLKVRKRLVH